MPLVPLIKMQIYCIHFTTFILCISVFCLPDKVLLRNGLSEQEEHVCRAWIEYPASVIWNCNKIAYAENHSSASYCGFTIELIIFRHFSWSANVSQWIIIIHLGVSRISRLPAPLWFKVETFQSNFSICRCHLKPVLHFCNFIFFFFPDKNRMWCLKWNYILG